MSKATLVEGINVNKEVDLCYVCDTDSIYPVNPTKPIVVTFEIGTFTCLLKSMLFIKFSSYSSFVGSLRV